MNNDFSPLKWQDGALVLLDQLRLPGEELWVEYRTPEAVATAIRDMVVRGAPAIGIAAAYGMALASIAGAKSGSPGDVLTATDAAATVLGASRPTAVNLSWAIGEAIAVRDAALSGATRGDDVRDAMVACAVRIHAEDIKMCRSIGQHGAELIPDGATVMTHCNAGALATGGYGTALGVIRAAHEAGKSIRVIANETRPFLQGARLTAWELMKDGIDVTIVPDSAAAFLISRGEVACAVVGADRIAANGDVANKIGTYGVALACKEHGVPFYVAAPESTIDRATATGADIPIEERSADELLRIGDTMIAPAGAVARYPAFDITPAAMISAIVTDSAVMRAPYDGM